MFSHTPKCFIQINVLVSMEMCVNLNFYNYTTVGLAVLVQIFKLCHLYGVFSNFNTKSVMISESAAVDFSYMIPGPGSELLLISRINSGPGRELLLISVIIPGPGRELVLI